MNTSVCAYDYTPTHISRWVGYNRGFAQQHDLSQFCFKFLHNMRCAQVHWSILVLFIPKISEVLVNQRLACDYPGKNNPAELFSAKSENTALDISLFSSDESR